MVTGEDSQHIWEGDLEKIQDQPDSHDVEQPSHSFGHSSTPLYTAATQHTAGKEDESRLMHTETQVDK